MVKFGVMLVNGAPMEVLVKSALAAEKSGVEYVLLNDHYVAPFEWLDQNTSESWVTLAYITAKTSTVKLGTCVTPLPLRPPPILAKMVTTIDHLSNGRCILGVGSGSVEKEFQMFGGWSPSGNRASKTAEGLRLIVELWTKDLVNFHGKFYSATNASLQPKPLQKPHPPIWLGSSGRRLMELTAGLIDGWIPGILQIQNDPERYRVGLETLQRYHEQSGRATPIQLGVVLGPVVPTHLKPKMGSRALGDLSDASTVIDKFVKLGCQLITLVLVVPNSYEEQIISMGRDLIPSFA